MIHPGVCLLYRFLPYKFTKRAMCTVVNSISDLAQAPLSQTFPSDLPLSPSSHWRVFPRLNCEGSSQKEKKQQTGYGEEQKKKRGGGGLWDCFLLTTLEIVCYSSNRILQQQLSLQINVQAVLNRRLQCTWKREKNISLLEESINNRLFHFEGVGCTYSSSFTTVKWLVGSASIIGPTQDSLFLIRVESRRMRAIPALLDNIPAFFILMKHTARSAG